MNRAQITTKTAWLGTEFGDSYARRLFGNDVVDALPRYVRGKNAGKSKATIEWAKVERGGWVCDFRETGNGNAGGHVEARVGRVIAARLIVREWASPAVTVLAEQGEPDDLAIFAH